MSSDGKVERDCYIMCFVTEMGYFSFHLQVANSDCKICSKKLSYSIKSLENLIQLPACNCLTAYFEHKI